MTVSEKDLLKAAIIGSLDLDCMGGGEANTVMFANLLVKLGYEVTYFGSGCAGGGSHLQEPGKNLIFKYYPSAYRHDPMTHPYVLRTSRLLSLGLVGLFGYKRTRKLLAGYDLYYFANPTLLSRKLIPEVHSEGKMVIIANHGTFFEYLGNSSMKFLRIVSNIAGKFLIEPLSSFDNIVIHTQNSFQTGYYRKCGFRDRSIMEIPQHNVNFDDYGISSNEGGFSVVFLGRLTESKGIHVLTEVAEMNPEIIFHIMGRGPMLNVIKSANVHGNMIIHGYVSDQDKRRILASSDAIIVPSVFESLSIASIEGLACGLPLVASKTAQGLQYIISKNSIFGKLLPRDAESFSLELRRLRRRKESAYADYVMERKMRREAAMKIFDEKDLLNELVKIAKFSSYPSGSDRDLKISTVN